MTTWIIDTVETVEIRKHFLIDADTPEEAKEKVVSKEYDDADLMDTCWDDDAWKNSNIKSLTICTDDNDYNERKIK